MPSDPPKSSTVRAEPIQAVPSAPAPGAEPRGVDPSRPVDDAARRIMHRTQVKAAPHTGWRRTGVIEASGTQSATA